MLCFICIAFLSLELQLFTYHYIQYYPAHPVFGCQPYGRQSQTILLLLVSFSFGGEGGDTGWHVINDLSLMCPGPTFTL